VRRGDQIRVKIGRKTRVRRLHRISIRRATPEANETVWANQNNAAALRGSPARRSAVWLRNEGFNVVKPFKHHR
jgi:hypothetical protein